MTICKNHYFWGINGFYVQLKVGSVLSRLYTDLHRRLCDL